MKGEPEEINRSAHFTSPATRQQCNAVFPNEVILKLKDDKWRTAIVRGVHVKELRF